MVLLPYPYIIQKTGIEGDGAKQWGIACDKEIFTRSGHGNVQLAVDDLVVLHEGCFREKTQLIGSLYGKTIDDVVTLASLITLDRVDGDLHKWVLWLLKQGRQLLANGRDLIAVWHNDANGFSRGKIALGALPYT